MLKFRCKNCDQKIGVPDDWRGHIVRCPRCKQGVDVPKNAELIDKPPPAPRSSAAKKEPSPAPLPAAPVPRIAPAPAQPVEVTPPVEMPAAAPAIAQRSVQPVVEIPLPPPIAEIPAAVEALTPIAVAAESIVIAPPPAVVPLPPINKPTESATMPTPLPTKAAPTPAKAAKKPAKKSKAETKSLEPAVQKSSVEVVAPPPVKEATPAAPEEPASIDPSVVAVTVARRTEPEPSPLAEPETGNVVNIAEALTQSVVTPKPIVTSAGSSDFSSIFSTGEAPETIDPIIDVEPSLRPTPVAVTVAEPALATFSVPPLEAEPIVTAVTMDAFTAFAGSQPQSEAFADVGGSDRALSEIVDVLPSEDLSPEGPSAATDLLYTLSRTSQPSHPPDGPADMDVVSAPAPIQTKSQERAKKTASGAFAISFLAMLSAAASLAMCVTHSHAHFAVPVGVGGLLLAVLATALAQGRSIVSTITGIGAAVASMIAIAIGVLIGLGMLPGSTAYARAKLAKNLPAARAGDVVVRIRSAAVLHPVLLTAPKKVGPTATTATQTVLRVEVELKNMSDHAVAQYTSWAVVSSGAEPVWLHDDEGNILKPLSAAGAVPVGRSNETVTIQPKGGTVGDVLLFEAPPSHARELDLQLPGGNVGSLEPLQLHIPAEMFARQ